MWVLAVLFALVTKNMDAQKLETSENVEKGEMPNLQLAMNYRGHYMTNPNNALL